MTWNGHTIDDRAVDDAWRAFADEDTRLEAPPGLEARVLDAVRHGRRPAPPSRRPTIVAGLSLAATLVLAAGWLAQRGATSPAPVVPVIAIDTTLRLSPFERTVEPHDAMAQLAGSDAPGLEVDASATHTLPPMLMSLGAAPLSGDEPLQLARLRLPREALQSLGVVLLEPDVGSVVDIDVLVGEDGLARDIRLVRTVQE